METGGVIVTSYSVPGGLGEGIIFYFYVFAIIYHGCHVFTPPHSCFTSVWG